MFWMICTSVGEPTVAACRAVLKRMPPGSLAEIRLDLIEDLTDANVRQLFSMPLRLVATCRPGKIADSERLRLLSLAIRSGASFVDVELESSADLKNSIAEAARKSGCKMVISFHDFQQTPSREVLLEKIGSCFAAGANLAKIACQTNTSQDAARLLGLLDSRRPLIVAGMGPCGPITRVAGPLLGSVWTFASLEGRTETASGQISAPRLEKILEEISHA